MLLAHISYFKLGVYTDTRGLLDSNRLERKPKNKRQSIQDKRNPLVTMSGWWTAFSFGGSRVDRAICWKGYLETHKRTRERESIL